MQPNLENVMTSCNQLSFINIFVINRIYRLLKSFRVNMRFQEMKLYTTCKNCSHETVSNWALVRFWRSSVTRFLHETVQIFVHNTPVFEVQKSKCFSEGMSTVWTTRCHYRANPLKRKSSSSVIGSNKRPRIILLFRSFSSQNQSCNIRQIIHSKRTSTVLITFVHSDVTSSTQLQS
jgi:hypothetical protein